MIPTGLHSHSGAAATCPAPECIERVRPGEVSCPFHWRQCPRAMRFAFHRARPRSPEQAAAAAAAAGWIRALSAGLAVNAEAEQVAEAAREQPGQQ